MTTILTKDYYLYYGPTISTISIIQDKYFEDGIIEFQTLFEDLRDEPTKKITMSK